MHISIEIMGIKPERNNKYETYDLLKKILWFFFFFQIKVYFCSI